MIDNVVLLITGTLHERDTHELLERCHPLGIFDTMPALCVATNVEELYHGVLVETPLGECRITERRPRVYAYCITAMQPLTSAIVFPLLILTTSTSKSSVTPSTRRISRISTTSSVLWVHQHLT